MIALEPQQRVEVRGAGGIAVGHRHDVGPRGVADRRIGGQRLVEDLADQGGRHLGRADQPRKMVAQRALEARLAEDGGVQRAGQHRLGRGRLLGGFANPGPDRIDRAGLRSGIFLTTALSMALSLDPPFGRRETASRLNLRPNALQAQLP